MGLDHFDKNYNVPLVKKGIFRYTNNGMYLFGLMVTRNSAPEPYRSHLPHPVNHRLIGYGQVEIVGKPGNPADGEKVLRVEVVKLDQAMAWFRKTAHEELSELYQMAEILSRQA